MKKYDLYLTGTVGWSISADYVKFVLDKSKGKHVDVAVCSLGGYVDTGLEIYELFRNHGDVTVEFLGMSASAATFMAMGAKHVRMAKNALILIHNSMAYIMEWGRLNKEQLDETLKRLKFQRDQLSTIDDVLAQIYADRNGKSIDEVKEKMKVAAWLKAADAVEFGIVDEVIEAEKPAGASNMVTNSMINDMGLPELPQGFDLETGEDTPAVGILQRAVRMLSGLIPSLSAQNKKSMKKIFNFVMAVLAMTDGFDCTDQGDITLKEDQLKKIDDQLKLQDEACKQAKTVIDSQKAEIKKLKDDLASKDQEIENLKKGPGESGNGGGQKVDDNILSGATELFNSIKDAM